MKGRLNNNGEYWFVIELNSMGGIDNLAKTYKLLPNQYPETNLAVGEWVDFELIRFCKEHQSKVETGPCTLDCAYDETTYAELIKVCQHSYSKSMYQEFPRKCVKCGEPEREEILVSCEFCDNQLDLAFEDTCNKCGRSHFEDPSEVFTTNDLHEAFKAGIKYMCKNTRPEDHLDFADFLKQLKANKNDKGIHNK